MADFKQTITFEDSYSSKVSRTFFITATDFPAAVIVAAANLLAVTALTLGGITKEELAVVTQVGGTPTAGANVDTGATFNFNLGNGKQAPISFPMILPAVVNPDRSIDISNVLVTDWTDQYVAGSILVSDGEPVISVIGATLDK